MSYNVVQDSREDQILFKYSKVSSLTRISNNRI